MDNKIQPHLVLPCEEYRSSFLEAIAEQPADQKLSRLEGNSFTSYQGDWNAFLHNLELARKGENLPSHWMPETVYWLVEDGKFLGRLAIRHMLNDHLRTIGGHIGYAIRPSERGKGYGSLILTLGLTKAKELGINPALLTCLSTNIASKKIIESHGGVFEGGSDNENGTTLRFWVPTS